MIHAVLPTFRHFKIQRADKIDMHLQTLLEKLSQLFDDIRIRQHLILEKAETPLRKGIFYLLGYESRAEPGFLCFLPDSGGACVFVNGRLSEVHPLRLRYNKSVAEKGTVLVASLDRNAGMLQLEDIWLDCGENLRRRPFSERWKRLQQFAGNQLVQDKKLSGFEMQLAKFRSLEELQTMVESQDFRGIDFIPEQGEKRRFFLPLGGSGSGSGRPRPERLQQQQQPKTITEELPESIKRAWAQRVVGMPDTYELFDQAGKNIGRAAVQNLSLSLQLRKETKPRFQVETSWHPDFLCYEIVGLQQNGA